MVLVAAKMLEFLVYFAFASANTLDSDETHLLRFPMYLMYLLMMLFNSLI